MKKRIGILTSGGDCPGLNATIRGVAKAAYGLMDCTIIGIENGYKGLIEGTYRELKPKDFSGLLTLGGTFLGTARTPFKKMRVIEEDGVDKVKAMVDNYKKMKLDCLITLGGKGTHKNANLLSEEGLNVIGLPKTIDNDIYGTDVTFGFQSGVDIATEVIDRIHTTADSHDRVMIIEIMGNKVGWLTLHAGMAGGADVILLPEIPYSIESVIGAIEKRCKEGKDFTIIAVAEGAKTVEEAKMKKEDFEAHRKSWGYPSVAYYLMDELNKKSRFETRACVPGHQQRGGSPSPYDRVLSTNIGAFAAKLIDQGIYGVTVSVRNNDYVATPLKDMAGKTKKVDPESTIVKNARLIGIKFGDEEVK